MTLPPPTPPVVDSPRGSSQSKSGQPTSKCVSKPTNKQLQPESLVAHRLSDWVPCPHLNGKYVYYFSAAQNIITPDDIGTEANLTWIEQPIPYRVEMQGLQQLRRIVEQRSGAPVLKTTYIDWTNRRVYGDILEEFQELSENAQFWSHVKAYPMHQHPSPEVLRATNSIVANMVVPYVEGIIGNDGTSSTMTEDQFERTMKLYHQLSTIPFTEQGLRNWLLASLALEIEGSQKALPIKPQDTSMRWHAHLQDAFFSVLLLGANRPYRETLRTFSAGSSSTEKLKFQTIMKGFLQEWADTNLLATVLLSCGVTFLSISDVDSVQKTVIIVSTLLALASILTGILHVRQHKAKIDSDLAHAWNYLHRGVGNATDTALLSAVLALPYAILLWSLLSFIAGILLHAFEDVSTPNVDFGRPLLGAIGALVLLVIFICVSWDTWKRQPTSRTPVTVVRSGEVALSKSDRCQTDYWGFVTRALRLLRARTGYGPPKETTNFSV